MRKYITQKKWKKYLLNRSKQNSKRKNKKKDSKIKVLPKSYEPILAKTKFKNYFELKAPQNFDLIKNTDEVLKFFRESTEDQKDRKKTFLNLENITTLSSDAITLLASFFNDKKFHHNVEAVGNAPKDPKIRQMFLQSGFYNFVTSRGPKKTLEENILHRETDTKILPKIAKNATINGVKYTYGKERNHLTEPIYNIIIEAMSNTNNHANLDEEKKINWWLFCHFDQELCKASYTFLDLGVGIFESIPVRQFFNLKRSIGIDSNLSLVPDLLSGKIGSRKEEDKEIRGKGIPEMIKHAQNKEIDNFYIITNNIKINMKTMEAILLTEELKGTLIHWELKSNHGS